MRKFIDGAFSAAIIFGLLSLLPPAYEGAATLPLWASISLIAAGLFGSAISAARNLPLD